MQLFWIAVAFAVPITLLLSRRNHWLLGWICLTTAVDVFNVRAAVNISAPTIAGLLLLPRTLPLLASIARTRPAGLMLVQYGLLVVLGAVFGFILPWADSVGRPWNLQAEGRTALYLMRQTAGISVALFVAQQVVRTQNPFRLLHFILVGTLFAAAAGVASYAIGPDLSLYNLITLGSPSPSPASFGTRAAGLNFEPRGLGLTVAHGSLLCLLLYSRHPSGKWLVALGLNLGALFLTRSTSSVIATGVACLAIFAFDPKVRRLLLPWALAAIASVAVVGLSLALTGVGSGELQALAPQVGQFGPDDPWIDMMATRVGTTIRFGQASNLFEELVFRTELFDAAALLFLATNPLHLLIGAGPGLVIFPASLYLPLTPFTAPYVSGGINSPPSMGSVLELANAGVIGLLLWLASTLLSVRALQRVSSAVRSESWRVGTGAFLSAAVIYLLAAGFMSSFWPLFMGLGFGAASLQRGHGLAASDRDSSRTPGLFQDMTEGTSQQSGSRS